MDLLCGAAWQQLRLQIGPSGRARDASESRRDRRLQSRTQPSGPLKQLRPGLSDGLVHTTEGSNAMQGMAQCFNNPIKAAAAAAGEPANLQSTDYFL